MGLDQFLRYFTLLRGLGKVLITNIGFILIEIIVVEFLYPHQPPPNRIFYASLE